MRLRVPAAYGIQEGQRYELTSHLPGQSAPPGLGVMVNRQAKVVRTQVISGEEVEDMDLGVSLSHGTPSVGPGDSVRPTWS
jgi:hypothetical protein